MNKNQELIRLATVLEKQSTTIIDYGLIAALITVTIISGTELLNKYLKARADRKILERIHKAGKATPEDKEQLATAVGKLGPQDRKGLQKAISQHKKSAALVKQAVGLSDLKAVESIIRAVSSGAKALGYILNAISRFGRWVLGPAMSKIGDMFMNMMEKLTSGRKTSPQDVSKLAKAIQKLPPEDRDRLMRILEQAKRA